MAGLLLGAIFGCVLRLRGRLVLHGSAVAMNGRVIALLGSKGAGKTTTALTLVRHGAALVTDDLVALIESPSGFQVPPGPPSLRLLAEPAQVLHGSFDTLRSLGTADMPLQKRCLDVADSERTTSSLPLDRIYVLAQRVSEGTACSIAAMAPAQGLATLMANRMCNLFLDCAGHGRDMQQLTRLIHQVPILRVSRLEGLENLDLVARTLLDPAVTDPVTN